MTGPLTTLALAGGIHVPPASRRADFEALADRGLADRCIDGGQHGYRISPQGRARLAEWAHRETGVEFP